MCFFLLLGWRFLFYSFSLLFFRPPPTPPLHLSVVLVLNYNEMVSIESIKVLFKSCHLKLC